MSTRPSLGAAFVATLGLAAYHVAQRCIPTGANPALVFFVMYSTGALVCALLLYRVFPIGPLAPAVAQLNAAAFLVAFAVLAAEFGTLWMYRSGWDVSVGGIVVNVASSLLLIPIGLLGFGERLNVTRCAGIALALVALVLLSLPNKESPS